ncbi:MAG: hypothetical protein ACI4YB_07060 [Oscillospiraceae bacterium]
MFVQGWKKETHEFKRQEIRETTYSVAQIGDEKLFQIQTYGTQGSSAGAKQIIQFDKERAMELVKILMNEFC